MELEVRTSPRLRNCFVALPMHLIYALQDGHGSLPALVILEARSTQDKGSWCLAWAGASSNSGYIEISDKYAECLELPSGAIVLVKALADVATAQTVLVEPASEDDWEILELNAEFLEEQVLSQVGILTAGQHFPVWVRGQNMLTLRVTSSSPKQVVKLAPGTELIVAPKERKQMQEPHELPSKNSAKALLRVQELDDSLTLQYKMGSLSCSILPTTVLFISPETASIINFKEGQLVILQCARLSSKAGKNQQVETVLRESKQNSNSNETQKDTKNKNRNVILRLVYCNLVCRGHAMLSRSLRQLLGARIHSRLLIRVYAGQPNQVQPVFSLSPAYMLPDEKHSANPDYFPTGNNGEVKDLQKTSETDSGDLAWKHLKHIDLITLLNDSIRVSQKGSNGDVNKKAQILFRLWLLAQMSFASRCGPLESYSVPLADEVILEFYIDSKSWLQKDTESTDKSTVHLDQFSTKVCYLLRLGGSDNISENVDLNRQHLEPLKYKGIFLLKGKIPLDWNSVQEILYDDDFLPLPEVRLLDISQPILSLLSDLGDVGGPNLKSLTWLKDPASEALDRLRVLLCPKAKEESRRLGLPSPGYVLLHGPPACGKTKLALAIANHLQDDPHTLAHRIYVRCSELEGEQGQTVRLVLKEAAFDAIKHAPSLIILDDLDAIISSSSTPESSELSSIAAVLSEFLADLIDSCQVHSNNRIDEPVAFLAIVQATSSLPSYLRCSGRFDLHIALQPPASTERAAILGQELIQRGISCEDDIISRIAAKCDGYDAVDLEILVDRAVHAAVVRFLSSDPAVQYSEASYQQMSSSEGTGLVEIKNKYELYEDDFTKALDGFAPVSMRDISKSSNQGIQLGWGDVGGLTETCQALKEMLELPVKFSKIFAEAPLRLRTGVLLYGPPGCGKTHIVGVAAAACSLRFISVKGPELLNKYIGASEQAVRDVFSKASAAAPCILFFDEFDAIAPKRGHDSTGVTDRVVNQFLTELDGVESLNGVFVFAATSRPDLLDAALLRPGRLDRLLFCDFPSLQDRFEILEVLSRKLNLSKEINLTEIAALAEGFSGADLQALLSDAQLEAVHVYLEKVKDNEGKARNEENPVITMDILHNITLKARPSVSYEEKRRLHNIYSSFTNGRSSVGVKSRDVKGKRSTLA